MGTPTTSTATMNTPMRPFTHPPSAVLLLYPVTLVIGSLFSLISPTARGHHHHHHHPGALAPTIAADQNLPKPSSQIPVNYFARKNNIFNLYFVKIGWVWTTLAFVSLLLSQPAYTTPSLQRGRRVAQAVLRYSLVTLVWYLTTQWFFGPAIIDRGFVITGGKCERVAHTPVSPAHPVAGFETLLTAAACKAAGGAWRGGHDVSGHIFMLVLASAFLAFEAWGVAAFASERGSVVDGGKEKLDSDGPVERPGSALDSNYHTVRTWSLRFVGVVVGLSWWMLFMTSIWFHTWLEKWSGLSIALGTVYVTYFLPRTLGSWRDIIGAPGV